MGEGEILCGEREKEIECYRHLRGSQCVSVHNAWQKKKKKKALKCLVH